MKKSAYLAPLLLAALGLNMAVASSAYAEEELTSSTVAEEITTNTVTVTATRSEKDILEVPMTVAVVTAEEIAKTPALTIADLLKNIPGVQIETYSNPSTDRVSIRNESTQRTLILVDGMKTSSYSANGTAITIDPSVIERIEVINGPSSVLYGSEAIGGVVNIITKKGGTKPIQGEFRTAYNSIQPGITTSLGLNGAMNDFTYRISGAYENLSNYETATRELPNSSKDSNDFSAYVDYTFNDKVTVGFGADRYQKNSEYQNFLLTGSYAIDAATSRTETEVLEQRYNAFVEARDLYSFLPKLRLNFAYQDEDSDSSAYNIATGLQTSDTSTTSYTTTMVGLQSDWAIADHTFIIAGYEFNRVEMKSVPDPCDGSDTSNAAYISVEHYLPADFTLSYGMRYTHIKNALDAESDSNSITDQSSSNAQTVFSAGLVWTGIDDLALRATYAQGFKAPNLYQKYVSGTAMGMYLYGSNPDLKPETSDNFEIGARYSTKNINADVAAYYTEAKNYITWGYDNLPAGYWFQYQNLGEVKKFGLEGSLDYTFDNGITPYFSGSYSRMKSRSDSSDKWNYLSGDPLLTANLGVRYFTTFSEGYYKFSADFNLTGQSDTVDTESDLIKGFVTANLSAGLEWGEDIKYFVQGQLNNIGDAKYQLFSNNSYYQPGLNTSLIFGVRF